MQVVPYPFDTLHPLPPSLCSCKRIYATLHFFQPSLQAYYFLPLSTQLCKPAISLCLVRGHSRYFPFTQLQPSQFPFTRITPVRPPPLDALPFRPRFQTVWGPLFPAHVSPFGQAQDVSPFPIPAGQRHKGRQLTCHRCFVQTDRLVSIKRNSVPLQHFV